MGEGVVAALVEDGACAAGFARFGDDFPLLMDFAAGAGFVWEEDFRFGVVAAGRVGDPACWGWGDRAGSWHGGGER